MGPLWAEIMGNIDPVVDPSVKPNDHTPAKFALVSGHDDTIMPLLVSLGPKVWSGEWPPYASMVLIEVRDEQKVNRLLVSLVVKSVISPPFHDGVCDV